jgi:hypothetical protein
LIFAFARVIRSTPDGSRRGCRISSGSPWHAERVY